MIKLRRFLYLLYYFKETDFSQINNFLTYSSSFTGKSVVRIFADSMYSVFRYNVSIKDYFCFRFFEVNAGQRKAWAGTG